MSSPLAIAAVTAALKDLLNDGLLNHDLSSIGSFSVTAQPPDRISTGENEPNQLNLFLYQMTPNLGWRNTGLPSRDARGTRLTNPPLALDLHYLLTAYGSQDLNAEILLGYAMQLLHETPVLSRQQLRVVLGGAPLVDGTILPSPFGTLSAIDLADQIELIKIAPVFLSSEDLSKMWTAMQARYRPSMAYTVSVVLIQSTASTISAPPVLRRGAEDRGPVAVAAPFPALSNVRPALSDLLPTFQLGDDLLLTGTNLDQPGAITVVFSNPRTASTLELPLTGTPSSNQASVHIPSIAEDADAMHEWSSGVYSVFLRIAKPSVPILSSNSVPAALSPRITVAPLNAVPGDINLTVTCSPRLRPEQEAQTLLVFGSTTVAPASITTPGDPAQHTSLTFTVPAVAAGTYIVRLRVDGIDSLPVIASGSPAKFDFDSQQRVTVA